MNITWVFDAKHSPPPHRCYDMFVDGRRVYAFIWQGRPDEPWRIKHLMSDYIPLGTTDVEEAQAAAAALYRLTLGDHDGQPR